MHNTKVLSWMLTMCALLLAFGAWIENAQAQFAPLYTFTGEAAEDYFGWSASGAGDVDGDGYADLIVGAWGYDAGGDRAGRAYVYSGRTGEVVWTFTGEAPYDFFGYSVSGAGDVNNDGYADLIVGAYWNDEAYGNAGRAYVYSGHTGGLLWTFTGESEWDELGYSVSGAGDVDSDGYADVIVGAPRNDTGGERDFGQAYIYSGRTGGLLWAFTGEAAEDYFGYSVSGAGDVDADGYADVIVGAKAYDTGGWPQAGRAYVYSGQTGTLLWTFTGEAADDEFGSSVSAAGDTDNDGYADLIIGAWGNDAGGDFAGRAYVYSGRTGKRLWTFTGEAVGDFFGHSVSGVGDVDADGHADVIVGAPNNDTETYNAGRAYIYSGRTGGLLQAPTGEALNDRFGYSVSGAGDVDLDGRADLIVGAPENDAGGDRAGRAYVFTCLPSGSVAGRVTADCPTPDVGLLGVTVDVFTVGSGDLVGTAVTDIDGNYQIDDLAPGDYTVSIVIPFWYSGSTDEITVTVTSGGITTADFDLTCMGITEMSPNSGFWKHEIGVALGGNGNAQLDATTLCEYLDLIAQRFNSNQINPVIVYVPPASGECADKLLVAKELLNLKGDVDMIARARQELMVILLNIAAGNMNLTTIVSDDGATLSQAITYCDNLIDDPDGDHQTAWEICLRINTGQLVGAGVIPLDTPDIAYKSAQDASNTTAVPTGFRLSQNYPNPFNAGTVIPFDLEQEGDWNLRIYNIAGQIVWSTRGCKNTGRIQIAWDGQDNNDHEVASGIYFYRLSSGSQAATKKMVLLR